MSEPYRDLGGLSRPDAYFGVIDFDCPTCKAKGRTLERDGEKCRQWNPRLNRTQVKKCPCLARIKLADKETHL